MAKLTARKVETLKAPGMYGDGEGLYLRVGPTGSKSWILRTRIKGRFTSTGNPLRWEGGLGSVSLVSLAEARERARELRKIARDGGNPSAFRDKEELTFREASQRVYESLRPTWRNDKHARNWLASMENHAFPKIGNRSIQSIQSGDVMEILVPIWTETHETARRLSQRISTVFDWAKGAGHYEGENPVNGLSKSLPRVKRRPEHLAAMAWRELPAFMSKLREREGVSARCLEFLILTASRSGEARGARWIEIEDDCWVVPGERMKLGIDHRVPLPPTALAVLERVKGLDSTYCFPSPGRSGNNRSRPMSDMVFKSLFKRMDVDGITAHGFRSAFRDWASEAVHAPREVAEAALSHAIGNEVERAYARSDLFERRRDLMERWADHVTGGSGEVVRMVR